MFRTDHPTAAVALPAPAVAGTPGYFTQGDPVGGVPATVVDQDFMNMLQEEMMAVVLAGSLTPSKTVRTQVRDAINAMITAASGGGSYSSNSIITTGTTFTSSSIGAAIEINSASATVHNLPAASAFANGKAISFSNIGAGIATFNRAGSDTITGGNIAAATAIPLNQCECMTLVSDGVSKWYVASSSGTFFGAPQTWQAVTRLANTNYPNSTGRSMDVNSALTSTSGATAICIITQNSVSTTVRGSSGIAGSGLAVYARIPNGATYSFGVDAGTPTIFATSEFR